MEILAKERDWSNSLSNFSAKLQQGSLRYSEAMEIAEVLGYEIIWRKRR